MHKTFVQIAIVFMSALLGSCASTVPSVGQSDLVVLSDSPAIEFSTGGWSHTNSTNPFLLTPDYLTNAMIGISRLQSGEPLLNGGPIIPEVLTTGSIAQAMATRLAGKSDLKLETVVIGGREVVHAIYGDSEKMGQEYAFVLNGVVLHVLLLAKPGEYYESGSRRASEIVRSVKSR